VELVPGGQRVLEGRTSSAGVGLDPTPGQPTMDAPVAPRWDREPVEEVAVSRSGQGYWSRVRHRFFRDKGAVVGAVIVLALILMAIFAQRLAPYDPGFEDPNGTTMLGAPLPPSPGHWLGTDANGRDALSRVIF